MHCQLSLPYPCWKLYTIGHRLKNFSLKYKLLMYLCRRCDDSCLLNCVSRQTFHFPSKGPFYLFIYNAVHFSIQPCWFRFFISIYDVLTYSSGNIRYTWRCTYVFLFDLLKSVQYIMTEEMLCVSEELTCGDCDVRENSQNRWSRATFWTDHMSCLCRHMARTQLLQSARNNQTCVS